MNAETPKITIWSLDRHGMQRPFDKVGIRIPLNAKSWLCVDFYLEKPRIAVSVSVHCDRSNIGTMPELRIRPRCGNGGFVSIDRGVGNETEKLEIIPVIRPVLTQSFREEIRKSGSGDPVGELAILGPEKATITDQIFVIKYDDIEIIEIAVKPISSFINVDISSKVFNLNKEQTSFRYFKMYLTFGGSNTVSFNFIEAIIPDVCEQ